MARLVRPAVESQKGTFHDKGFVMKHYQHELAHSYEHKQSLFSFGSGSLFQSLTTAGTIGVLVAVIGFALNALWHYRQSAWYLGATFQSMLQLLIVTFLVTIVLEQRRKRSIRHTLELAFLNHHIRNAITQMASVSYIENPEKQERLMFEAAGRISEALFRVANSADLTGLSLEVDLSGVELARGGGAREKGEEKKAS
jgi:hypothetical protein